MFDKFLKNAGKPEGFLGSLMIKTMNIGHTKMTVWALEKLKIKTDDKVLDVGCGGGKTINFLSQVAPKGKICGIDYSEKSVDISKHENSENIKNCRVEIRKAGVSSIPYPDGSFDCVTSFESFYFWPDPENDLKEILRVLKPGGHLALVLEMYKNEKFDERNKGYVKKLNMNYLSRDEFVKLFESAGYCDIKPFENEEKGWICVIGTKPAVQP